MYKHLIETLGSCVLPGQIYTLKKYSKLALERGKIGENFYKYLEDRADNKLNTMMKVKNGTGGTK